MPLYEYRCRKCGHLMEVLQKLSDPPIRKCDRCASRVDKLISRTAFQLKGEGWFAHGYGAEGNKKKSEDAKGSSPAKGSSEAKATPPAKETGESSTKKSEPDGGSNKAAVAGR